MLRKLAPVVRRTSLLFAKGESFFEARVAYALDGLDPLAVPRGLVAVAVFYTIASPVYYLFFDLAADFLPVELSPICLILTALTNLLYWGIFPVYLDNAFILEHRHKV
jgi:hypothetical protein